MLNVHFAAQRNNIVTGNGTILKTQNKRSLPKTFAMTTVEIIGCGLTFCAVGLMITALWMHSKHQRQMRSKLRRNAMIQRQVDEIIDEETCFYVDATGLHETFKHPI